MKKKNEDSLDNDTEDNSAENIIHIPSTSELSASTQANNERRFSNIESLVYAVLFVALVSLVGIVIAVVTLVIDQMHFNNETYREQSINLQTQIELLKAEINSLKK